MAELGLSARDPTIKSTIALALDDAGKPIGYRDIQDAIHEAGVAARIPVESIRVAASELRSGLEQIGSRYRLSDVRAGREKRFSLLSAPVQFTDVAADLSPPVYETAEEIALNLVAENVLPARSLYCLPFAAHSWIVHSHKQSELRQRLAEQPICDRLLSSEKRSFTEFRNAMVAARRLSVLGLGVGEGLGEISLIAELLSSTATDDVIVDYLCVDRSPLLLFSHVEEVKEHFNKELGTRLRCAGVCGDFLELDDVIARAKRKAAENGVTNFLPQSAPALLTLFGNVLGNTPTQESQLIRSFRASIRNRPMGIAFGVSTPRPDSQRGNEAESYSDATFEFFAATPRHVLRHHGDAPGSESTWSLKSTASDEFSIPFDAKQPFRLLKNGNRIRVEHFPEYKSPDRSGAMLCGELYNFKYILQGDLTLKHGERSETAYAGTEILLYSVVKIDLPSLETVLTRIGFEVELDGPFRIAPEDEPERWYGTAIAVIDKG